EGYDHPHLNLILRNAEEIIEGEKKRELEKVIVRGDNIVYILPS
ncbi:MAG TPA: small nuclear ribonucleoprotein, partial [Thermoplasmatales archaeon]|nr:small nuclear ribonucleoprotein [Thermoplasmatales archaeon]